MKVVSRYCDSCGIKIPATEIKDGVALKYEESYYCKDCKAEILPLIEQKKGKAAPAPAAKPAAAASAPAAERSRTPTKPIPAAKGAGNGASNAKPLDGKPLGKPPLAKPAAGKTPPRPIAGVKRPGAAAAPARPGVKTSAKPRPGGDEEDEAPEGSDADLEAAEDAPPRKLPLIPIAIVAVVLVAGAVWFFVFRSSGGAAAKDEVAVHEKTPDEIAREKNRAVVAAADAQIAQNPSDVRGAIHALEKADASLVSASDIPAVQGKIHDRLEKLAEELDADGKKAFEATFAKADAQRKSGDFDGALATFRAFPEEYRETLWWTKNIPTEIEHVEKQLAAKREAEPLLKKAADFAKQKEFMVAVGVLEGFDVERYRDSEYAPKVKKAMGEYQALASARDQEAVLGELAAKEKKEKEAEDKALAEKRAQEDKRIAGLPWKKVLGDDLFTWHLPEPMPKDVWKVDKATKELTGKCGAALKGQDFGAMAGTGEANWGDAIVEFRYKIVKGGFRIGARFNPQQHACIDLIPEMTADGQWHTVQVSVRGEGSKTDVAMTEGGAAKKCEGKDLDASDKGGFAFVLLPNSEVVFADLKVKVISTK